MPRTRRYKIEPCIHSKTLRKGYKLVDQYGNNYCPDGRNFIVYHNYKEAEENCDHLNGNSNVWGVVTKNSWEVFKDFMRLW